MIGGVNVASAGMLGAAGVVVVFAIVYALARGDRRDPLERLATWAGTRGLEYVAPKSDGILAIFVGTVEGSHVEVVVSKAARGFGVDLPSKVTTITVGHSSGDVVCVLQSAAWVMDRYGGKAAAPVPTGDALFDERWSTRGDADAVGRLLTPQLHARLLEEDADGLIVELSQTAVAIPMPGVCSDGRELERRLTLVLALDRTRTA